MTSSKPDWECTTCGSQYEDRFVICFRCFTHRPPVSNAYPSIFQGCVFHFNGIIQRSLLNQSFNKEWRMAQAHGALCTSDYAVKAKDSKVTHLIYRTGYERSDKVRAAVNSGRIFVVPIEWMLDSMMQGNRIPETDYCLKEIPSRSLPIDNSNVTLEHHRHAYYVAQQDRFAEPSPEAVAEAKALAQEEQRKRKPLGPDGHIMMTTLPNVDAPRVHQPIEPWPVAKLSQAGSGSLSRPLFCGLRFLFTESCPSEAVQCAHKLGVTTVTSLTEEPTHVLYVEADKRGTLCSNAISALLNSSNGHVPVKPQDGRFILCPLQWLQDCIQAHELLPNYGPYIVPAKLLQSASTGKAR